MCAVCNLISVVRGLSPASFSFSASRGVPGVETLELSAVNARMLDHNFAGGHSGEAAIRASWRATRRPWTAQLATWARQLHLRYGRAVVCRAEQRFLTQFEEHIEAITFRVIDYTPGLAFRALSWRWNRRRCRP